MLIDETHEIAAAPPADIRSTLGGEKDKPSDDEGQKPEKPAEEQDKDLDEELDESFPASDPPSQTQP